MYPYSEEDEEDDIEFDEIVLLDEFADDLQPFSEDEAAMADLEIDWDPTDSGGCHRASR